MSEVVVIPDESATDDDAGVAFAAGVATAEATHAAQEAAEAAVVAESAVVVAEAALEAASEAAQAGWATQDEISSVRGDLAELRAMVADLAVQDAAVVAEVESSLTPERIEREDSQPTGEKAGDKESSEGKSEKPSGRRRYGHSGWFGG